MPEKSVTVESLTKRFRDVVAVNNICFDVDKGDFFVMIGPSGCGKTTTLRCIAGLEKPDSGTISIEGRDVTGVPTNERNISLIFQNFALFPHKTVAGNIAFGLRMKGQDPNKIKTNLEESLKLAGLEGLGGRYPRELSEGQKQRVALARSLIVEPGVLLLDEPLGSIDYLLQQRMLVELKELHQRLGLTFIYVTHSQEQALSLAHTIMVMNQGVIEQIGSPDEIYSRPKTVFVAKFVGEINMLRGDSSTSGNVVRVKTDLGEFESDLRDAVLTTKQVAYAIRPEKIFIGEEATKCANRVTARLIEQIYKGSDMLYVFELQNGTEFRVTKQGDSIVDLSDVRDQVLLGWNRPDALVLDKPSAVEGIDIDRVLLGE